MYFIQNNTKLTTHLTLRHYAQFVSLKIQKKLHQKKFFLSMGLYSPLLVGLNLKNMLVRLGLIKKEIKKIFQPLLTDGNSIYMV